MHGLTIPISPRIRISAGKFSPFWTVFQPLNLRLNDCFWLARANDPATPLLRYNDPLRETQFNQLCESIEEMDEEWDLYPQQLLGQIAIYLYGNGEMAGFSEPPEDTSLCTPNVGMEEFYEFLELRARYYFRSFQHTAWQFYAKDPFDLETIHKHLKDKFGVVTTATELRS